MKNRSLCALCVVNDKMYRVRTSMSYVQDNINDVTLLICFVSRQILCYKRNAILLGQQPPKLSTKYISCYVF